MAAAPRRCRVVSLSPSLTVTGSPTRSSSPRPVAASRFKPLGHDLARCANAAITEQQADARGRW